MKYSDDYLGHVLKSYIECALWVTFDFDDFELNVNEASMLKAKADIKGFLDDVPENDIYPSQMGHDLFLTRNKHAAGFWDRHLEEKEPALRLVKEKLGNELTELADNLGEVDVYVGDDGLVVIE